MFDALQLRVVAELAEDPNHVVETALDVLQHGRPQATSWMQKLRGARSPVSRHSVSGSVLYDGRLCCGEALRRFEGRTDLEMPYLVPCPDCGRVFRVKLDVVRRS